MKKTLRMGLVAGVSAALVMLAGCSSAPTGSTPSGTNTGPRAGGTLAVGIEGNWQTLDPMMASGFSSQTVMMALYGKLFYPTREGKIEPGMAERYEANEAATVYTVHLREDVKFSDGTAFDAEAVKFNLDRARDPKSGSTALATLSGIESIEARDARTVVITLSKPSAAFPLAVLASSPSMIASPTAIRQHGAEYAKHPVGAGPFKFKDQIAGNSLSLVKWEGYWQSGRPYLDGVDFKVMQSGETRYASLKSGVIQVADAAVHEQISKAEKDPTLKVENLGALGTRFVMFQSMAKPFDDIRARQAVSYATDGALISKELFGGRFGNPVQSPFPPGHPFAPKGPVSGYPAPDLAKAKALVAELGGLSFEFTLESGDPFRMKTAEALVAQWAKAGIKATIRTYDQATLIERAFAHQFQAMMLRWQGRDDPDDNTYPFFHSAFATPDKPSRNYGLVKDDKVDQLLQDGRKELDLAKRQQIYVELSERLAEVAPRVYLWGETFYRITSADVHGIPQLPSGLDIFIDAYRQ